MKIIPRLLMALAILLPPSMAWASDLGTAKEAEALIDKAITKIQSDGDEAAFAAFNTPDGGFVDRDLYIFAIDGQGVVLAHGANKGLIGKNLVAMNLKDPDGVKFVEKFLEIFNSNGEGWVDYKWVNPDSKKVEQKSSLIKKVNDRYFIGCGIYK